VQGVVRQLAKYAVAGAAAAAIYAGCYLLIADHVLPPGYATLAVVPAFLISLSASFVLHSWWTFGGHGTRTRGVRQVVRFVAVQSLGLGLNAALTYVVAGPLGGANWQALIPCLTITPLVTFAAQRAWVFA
jgi:putative flippase GtrA